MAVSRAHRPGGRLAITFIAVVLFALQLLGSSAIADAASADPVPPQSVATPSSTESFCTHRQLGGRFICEYGEIWHRFPNGTWQYFVIGTDYSIWTKWSRTNGTVSSWTSMGGKVRSGVYIFYDGTWTPTIAVIGTDGNWFYRDRGTSGTWTAWHR
jgi:hypothetical protein